RRVASPDVRHTRQDVAEPAFLRELLEQRAGIGDGNEVLTGLFALDLPHALEEVAVEDQRLGGRAGLARDDAEGLRQVHPLLEATYLGRHGAVEHVQLRMPGPDAEGHAEDMR